VRGLVVVVLVTGSGLGWIVQEACLQRDTVAAIQKNRGHVTYDWERIDESFTPVGKPWAPRWLVDILGVDYFGHVISVWLPGKTDADNIQVRRLSRLQHLSVGNSFLSDTGMEHLTGLTELSDFELQNTQVTDAGLAHLIGSTNLKHLNLSGTQVTDAGMTHLRRLTNIEVINLNYTEVGNAGLADLIVLTKLRWLSLNGTQVTDAGLAHLKRPTNLLWLGVGGTKVTDAGMKALKVVLPNLTVEN